MANKVLLKKSSVAAKVPLTTDLDYGEVALNYNDAKLFFKKSDGTTVDHFPSATATSTLSNKTLINPVVTADASTVALQINRVTGQPSIKSGGTDGYLIMDSASVSGTGVAALNWFSSDNVVLAQGGGNVGIGTTTPSAKLHVYGPNFPLARIERNTALTTGMRSTFSAIHSTSADMVDGFGVDISFGIKDSAGVDNEIANFGAIRDGADNSGALVFSTVENGTGQGSVKMILKASGDVGIGVPTPQYKLDVWEYNLSNTYTATSTTLASPDIVSGISYRGSTQNIPVLMSFYDTPSASVWYHGSSGGTASQNADYVIGNRTGSTAYSEKLRIDSTGLIGIGTSNPSTLLHLYRGDLTSGTVDMLRLEGNLSDLSVDPLALGLLFRIKDGNNVGAEARIRMAAVNDSDYNTDTSEDNAHLIVSLTNTSGVATDRLILNSLGNMGLGTMTPTAQIDLGSTFYSGTPSTLAQNLNKIVLYSTGTTGYYGFGISTGALNITAGESGGKIRFMTGGTTQRVVIDNNGNVGIDVTSPIYKLHVNGSFAATTKSFVIPHPTKENKFLRYGSLEGPENGVYVRGRLTNGNTIELPEYWTKLVDPDSITVDLTPIGSHQKLYVKDIVNNTVVVGNENVLSKTINCFYTVYAERVDVEKLEVEIEQ